MDVPRHPVDTGEARADLDHYRRRLDRSVALLAPSLETVNATPANLGTLASTARTYAGLVAVVDPDSLELYRAARIAAYALTQVCRLAALPDGTYEVFVGEGEPVLLPSGVTSYSSGISWLQGFYLAAACREVHLLDTLAAVPVEVLRRSSTRSDDYLYLHVEALQGFHRGDPDTPRRVLAAMEATDPARVRFGTVDAALNLAVPELDLLWRLIDRDTAAFDAALGTAVERHRHHWGTGHLAGDPHGFLAPGPVGLAAIAHDAGMSVTVRSGYVPDRLLRGRFS
ncbi:MAG TPA: immunity 49 family protein [Pseudonocardia sp.]|nr:immunity 49 family protein [Pseudonocardia sp.]